MKNELEPLMTLRQASVLLFGSAGKIRALRTEIDKGNLIPRRIANTLYVSEQDLREMCERCREAPKKQDFNLDKNEPGTSAKDATKALLNAYKSVVSD
ncbi:MAG: hypothetical protein GY761_00315 [Hyphomicrobiales bacterium]|nr:hypothetical protein [Hyphomicrobiales bacterium]